MLLLVKDWCDGTIIHGQFLEAGGEEEEIAGTHCLRLEARKFSQGQRGRSEYYQHVEWVFHKVIEYC